jgi:hypothetical protein
VEQLNGIVAILDKAEPEDRRAVYQQLNISNAYHTDSRLQVKAGPNACPDECVGGGTTPGFTWVRTHENPRFPSITLRREAASVVQSRTRSSSRRPAAYDVVWPLGGLAADRGKPKIEVLVGARIAQGVSAALISRRA